MSNLSGMKIETESLNLEQLQQQNAQLEQQNAELSAKLKWYEEQFRLAQQKRFGASSEKTHPDQMELNLFNEAEVIMASELGSVKEAITYERRKTSGKREADLSKLPVETVTYALAEGEKICRCCGGSLHEMTTETRREIAVVPPQVKVVEHVRQVCACRHCERHELQTPIVTAAMPRPVYPGSLASPSAIAHVMCQKYVSSRTRLGLVQRAFCHRTGAKGNHTQGTTDCPQGAKPSRAGWLLCLATSAETPDDA